MSSPPTKLDQQLDQDQRIRQAAFEHVCKLIAKSKDGLLTREQLIKGFDFIKGKRFSLIHPQWGGYKPDKPIRMSHLLSIKSTLMGKKKYDNPVPPLPELGKTEPELWPYPFRGENPDPNAAQNRYLLDAWEHRIPLLYFLEAERQRFVPAAAEIVKYEPEKSRVWVSYTALDCSVKKFEVVGDALERKYAEVTRKRRLHQRKFHKNVYAVYQGRCAISGLSEKLLLEAAHIIPDHRGGQPEVSNGLLLSAIHHKAFDANLIGITPSYRVEVSKRLLKQDSRQSGLLALLKKVNGKRIRLPDKKKNRPDRDFLGQRYKEFQAADKS